MRIQVLESHWQTNHGYNILKQIPGSQNEQNDLILRRTWWGPTPPETPTVEFTLPRTGITRSLPYSTPSRINTLIPRRACAARANVMPFRRSSWTCRAARALENVGRLPGSCAVSQWEILSHNQAVRSFHTCHNGYYRCLTLGAVVYPGALGAPGGSAAATATAIAAYQAIRDPNEKAIQLARWREVIHPMKVVTLSSVELEREPEGEAASNFPLR